ncbi:MAG: hypothetical protein AAF411_08740 [Myxococcota bacterium]
MSRLAQRKGCAVHQRVQTKQGDGEHTGPRRPDAHAVQRKRHRGTEAHPEPRRPPELRSHVRHEDQTAETGDEGERKPVDQGGPAIAFL